jgi:Cu-processing system permease protein
MNTFAVARDVLREAFVSRAMLVLFVIIGLVLLGLALAIDFDVVDGALASFRLFGQASSGGTPLDVETVLRPIFQLLAGGTFYVGLLFGIIATADIAPRLLQPGRVEFMLSLPIRRVELVVGTYLGVAALCAIGTGVAVGGVSLVLFFKAKMVVAAPLWGALMAVVGFLAVYAVMLPVGALTRSPALSAAAGFFLYIAGLLVSQRLFLLSWTSNKVVRQVLEVLTTPLPNLKALADLGAGVAGGGAIAWEVALPQVGGVLAFAAFGVFVAAAIVQTRDY